MHRIYLISCIFVLLPEGHTNLTKHTVVLLPEGQKGNSLGQSLATREGAAPNVAPGKRRPTAAGCRPATARHPIDGIEFR